MLVASTAGSPDHAARIAKSTATVRPRGSLKILGRRFGAHEAYLDTAAGVIAHKPPGSPDELSDKPLESVCRLVHDLRVTGPHADCGFHGLPAYGPFSMIDTIPSSV